MHDTDGRLVYPRAPGIHTVQVRTGRRKFAQMGRARDFSPENGGYTSPVFEIQDCRRRECPGVTCGRWIRLAARVGLRETDMFENELQTRARSAYADLLATIFFLAHLPHILLIVPSVCCSWALLRTRKRRMPCGTGCSIRSGSLTCACLTGRRVANYDQKKHYFWFGEVGMAAFLAGTFAIPVRDLPCGKSRDHPGIHRGCQCCSCRSLCSCQKLIQRGMKADHGCGH